MNLVGHVAVAVRDTPTAAPPYLLGCMLPDLAAMARLRIGPAPGELGGGVAFHHATDAAFHSSRWFNRHNQSLRDHLLEAGVDRGPARACAHAGLEMLLDGELAADPLVSDAVARAFTSVHRPPTAAVVRDLVAEDSRGEWSQRLTMIGESLDPLSYRSPDVVAHRLHRMTSGRTRIELHAAQIPVVAAVLAAYRPDALADAFAVVDEVISAVRASEPSGV